MLIRCLLSQRFIILTLDALSKIQTIYQFFHFIILIFSNSKIFELGSIIFIF